MARQPSRGRRKRKTPGSPRRDAPPMQWLTRRPRLAPPSPAPCSVGCSECGGCASDETELHVRDPVTAAAPCTPQCKAEIVEDEFGQLVVAGEGSIEHLSDAQQLEIRDGNASRQPSAASNKYFTIGPSSSLPLRAPVTTWQGTVLCDMTAFPQIVKEEIPDPKCQFRLQEDWRNLTQPAAVASELGFKRKTNTKSLANRQGGSRRGRPSKRPRSTEPAAMDSSSDARPPHPYATGKVSKVNICPVCEKYTVTELDRPEDSDPNCETLRARFKCDLCRKFFDLGITLFDPRGSPGVTLYEGDDRFTPPAPPRATYPCPGCWMRADTSFQCMTVYLKDETRVPCQPACPADRMNLLWAREPKPQKKKSMQQVMGWM